MGDSICKQGQWSEIIKEKFSYFKQFVSSEFEDDPILQFYIKYKVSSIFNGMSLYHIFCHIAFGKRSRDSGVEFCRMYSRVCGNRFIQTFELFEETLIDDHFADKFKAFFLPKYYIYLDILYHKYYK